MVEPTIGATDPNWPGRRCVATRGKHLRAEPISAFFEQHRVHMVGEFPQLEDQLCGWSPEENGPSPDRLDSMVWLCTELMGGPPPMQINSAAVAQIRSLGRSRRYAF